MQFLTQKEEGFLLALKKDWEHRGEKSFIAVMFWSQYDTQTELLKSIESLFSGYPEMSIIGNSDLLFECIAHQHVGKYENVFWCTGSEGELFAIGTKLYQVPYNIFCNRYSYQEDKLEGQDIARAVHGIDYAQYVEEYKVFCRQFGWEYIEEFEEPNSIIQDFDKLVENLQ